jgi:hypothetical protein
MNATQKQRMKKVTTVHLVLTFIALVFVVLFAPALGFSNGSRPSLPLEIWVYFWLGALVLLQPVPFLIGFILQRLFSGLPPHSAMVSLGWLVVILAIPLWSYCFSWIFIRAKDWLNHFPVLGKRVF